MPTTIAGAGSKGGVAAGAGARGLSVLVADDSATLRAALGMMLRALGHRVVLVGDGAEAVEAAARADFDVVLLDVQMPVLGGLEAARRIIAAARGGRRPRVVAFSAEPIEEAPGVDAVLEKPVRLAALVGAVAAPA
jgi:CheY-like chemotaxis protein